RSRAAAPAPPRARGEGGFRRHPSPPLAGVPWGRIARSVPAIPTPPPGISRPRRGWSGVGVAGLPLATPRYYGGRRRIIIGGVFCARLFKNAANKELSCVF